MFKRRWVIAAGAAALVVVLGAGAVMAQSPDGAPGSTFLDRVAEKLGIDTPKLQKAITDTRNEDIDKAVQEGDLTQKQADALKEKIQNAPGLGERGFGGPGFGGHGVFKAGPKGFSFGFGAGLGLGLEDAEKQLADFLGISTDQLSTELKADDATLATVAEAHGKSRDQLKSFITDKAKAKLDEAVNNGDLTQKHADAFTEMLTNNIDKLIDGKFSFFWRGIERHRFGPGMPGVPKTTPDNPNAEPQSGSRLDNIETF